VVVAAVVAPPAVRVEWALRRACLAAKQGEMMLLHHRRIDPLRLLILGVAGVHFAATGASADSETLSVKSPNGTLTVDFCLDEAGVPHYWIERDGQTVLDRSRLGLVRNDADFSQGLKLVGESPVEPIEDRYEILTAKRRVNDYQANRKVFHLQAAGGEPLDVVFQVSNDGVAFRYEFPDTRQEVHQLTDELSSFHFLPESKAWLQPKAVAKSGWEHCNPSYEEYYEKEISVGTAAPTGAGWVFPALFRTGDTWLLVSESGLRRNYCGGRLRSESPRGEYTIGFADPREGKEGGPVLPESTLPWKTPWRLIVVGDLATIAESTLGIDLADPPAVTVAGTVEPGKASWSWPLLGDAQTTFDVQQRFIDYAAEMGWRYCLVDALWDKQIGYEKLAELVDYARGKNVKILVWYNSAGDWNTTPQTPRNKMLTHESRVAEFDKLKSLGVAGLKVDFFGGDGQSMIAYYHDILTDAAPYGFALNFHGATLPRGWQRTYPNLMTMEAIRGLEFVTFEQANADQEPTHAAMLPFTRNVFDPMDFTPVVLDRIRNIQRRTTSAFELALAVLFTSGIQHYAEIPEGMDKAPDYVREFLKVVPSVWDDTKFLDGYPGKFVVLARRGGGKWYLAGINAETTPRRMSLDLRQLTGGAAKGTLITDGAGGNLSFRKEPVDLAAEDKLDLTLAPRGGFVMVLD
jgi:alpha-glucosidase